MGIGIALGGVTKGLESAENARVAQQEIGLRQQALGIQDRALKRGEQNDLINQTASQLSDEIGLVTSIIEKKQQAGQSPEKITQDVSGLLPSIDRLAGVTGRDPASIRAQFDALIQTPVTADPNERKQQLQVDKLEREAAGDKARVEDVRISVRDARDKLKTLKEIPGSEFFLLNPTAIPTVRQALSSQQGTGLIAQLLNALGVNELPSALLGMSKPDLKKALDAAETVNKQRNAVAQILQGSNQAGAAGLSSQLTARGEGAGLDVQDAMFEQVEGFTTRILGKEEVPESTGPLPLPDTEEAMKKGQVYNLPDGRQALWNGKALELLN